MRLYHHLLFCLFILTGLSSCASENAPVDSGSTAPEASTAFSIHRGVNISHWLSQSGRRGEERADYFTEKDVKAIADAGFDHIRIPVDEEQLWDSLGNKETAAFDLLHQALGWMAEHDLKAVVDLHILRSHHFLDEAPALWTDPREQEKFAGLWTQLSGELEDYPLDMVAYELLNEAVADDHDDWNKVYRLAYDAVRAEEPDRTIVIGTNRWQNAANMPYLKVPENDPNIILSYHFYLPFMVTHYQASWMKMGEYTGPVNYPGMPVEPEDTVGLSADLQRAVWNHDPVYHDKAKLEELMMPAIQKADSLNLPLYCGEFGCRTAVPDEIRKQWFRDVISIFEKHHIAWAAWDHKSDGFGMFKEDDLELRLPEEVVFQ